MTGALSQEGVTCTAAVQRLDKAGERLETGGGEVRLGGVVTCGRGKVNAVLNHRSIDWLGSLPKPLIESLDIPGLLSLADSL